MTDFLWLLILVDGPLMIGLALAYLLLHRLPPIEGTAQGGQAEPRFLYLRQHARKGLAG